MSSGFRHPGDGVEVLVTALEKIAADAPLEEPEYEDWGGDTEEAERWGMEHGAWTAAQTARRALAAWRSGR